MPGRLGYCSKIGHIGDDKRLTAPERSIILDLNHRDEPLAQAEQLLADLSGIYSDFTDKNTEEDRTAAKRITRLFTKWFSGFNPLSANPDQQAFLDEVQRIATQLASLFEDAILAYPDACRSDAARAVSIMMPSRPTRERTAEDWSLTAAEYHIASFLPYLSQEELSNIHAKLLKRTPKRLMLPKQLELLKMIDKRLKP